MWTSLDFMNRSTLFSYIFCLALVGGIYTSFFPLSRSTIKTLWNSVFYHKLFLTMSKVFTLLKRKVFFQAKGTLSYPRTRMALFVSLFVSSFLPPSYAHPCVSVKVAHPYNPLACQMDRGHGSQTWLPKSRSPKGCQPEVGARKAPWLISFW